MNADTKLLSDRRISLLLSSPLGATRDQTRCPQYPSYAQKICGAGFVGSDSSSLRWPVATDSVPEPFQSSSR